MDENTERNIVGQNFLINKTSEIDRFHRLVQNRTKENMKSVAILINSGNYSVAIGLLRQEIDTFVRLVYLGKVSDDEAKRLVNDLVDGKQWQHKFGKSGRITDREMVNEAKQKYFWVEIAYEFGCKLIHLSEIHDYENIDPFTRISFKDKNEIISYLKSYHGYSETNIDIERFITFLPSVMKKIQDKVIDYNNQLLTRLKPNE
jgi:hypothetical protein